MSIVCRLAPGRFRKTSFTTSNNRSLSLRVPSPNLVPTSSRSFCRPRDVSGRSKFLGIRRCRILRSLGEGRSSANKRTSSGATLCNTRKSDILSEKMGNAGKVGRTGRPTAKTRERKVEKRKGASRLLLSRIRHRFRIEKRGKISSFLFITRNEFLISAFIFRHARFVSDVFILLNIYLI